MPQRLVVKPAYRSQHSSRIALSVPIELKRQMARNPVNWSKVFQRAVRLKLAGKVISDIAK